MSSRAFSSGLVAYASMAVSNSTQESDFEFLQSWCRRIPIEMDLLAEDVHPTAVVRPFWNEILKGIESGSITTLIVPSLFHIAGEDFISLSKFLVFLKAHRVALKSLIEVIDSRRDSNNDIVLRLIQNVGSSAPGRATADVQSTRGQ